MHLARLNRVGQRQPFAIEKSHGGLGADPAPPAAAGVTERTKRLAIEEISRPARQSAFNRRRRLGRDHVKQLELRTGGFKSRGFTWDEKYAGALLGRVRLAVEADDAVFRRFDDVEKGIVAAG